MTAIAIIVAALLLGHDISKALTVKDLRLERDIKSEVCRVYQEEKFKEYKI